MHHTTGAFQANNHLILWFYYRQYRRHLFTQRADFMGIHTAFKIKHPDTRFTR
ncbi:hypothetical protein D3C81_1974110 [compost metagenome]